MARKNEGGINPDAIDAKVAALKAVTREANEAVQAVREVMREAKKYREELESSTQKVVDDRVAEAVAIGMESFKEALDKAIEGATERTYGRFDELAALLLGEDRKSVRKGQMTMPEMVGLVAEARKKL